MPRNKSIDKLKTLLNHNISAGNNRKLSVYVNEKQPSEQNCINLFYTEDADFVSTSRAAYYDNQIQIAIRHNNYNQARDSSYFANRYVRIRSKTNSSVYFIVENTPIFLGEDARTKGYWWGFNVRAKGGE